MRTIRNRLRHDQRGAITLEAIASAVMLLCIAGLITFVAVTLVQEQQHRAEVQAESIAAEAAQKAAWDDATDQLRTGAALDYGLKLSARQVDRLVSSSHNEVSVTVNGEQFTVHAVPDRGGDLVLVIPDGTELPHIN
ncbi:hypothetical protein [Leifsonia sp. Leaf264]|uniref:hypothetical protein n=1 Tax=Leifsonia sp. Leaf264 TaxID=1736314 RepID=UPI0006FB2588|nr:hypothetical protein [Leifsonia sp. Leaf264]KQO98636.1 hypothetical protein ASF30_11275 [Leifsonia sp. Leaf264]